MTPLARESNRRVPCEGLKCFPICLNLSFLLSCLLKMMAHMASGFLGYSEFYSNTVQLSSVAQG